MKNIRIINANIINEGDKKTGDLVIKNNRIENISSSINGKENEVVFDANGSLLLPGMIDAHVHFREPGLTNKGSLYSESRAAVAGGITSIMEMPNTVPAAVTNNILEEKFALAKKNCMTNYSFYLGATNNNIDELISVDKKKVCGVKLFLGSSTGNLMVDSKDQIEDIFNKVTIPVALHCEVDEIIKNNEQIAYENYGENVPFNEHSKIRSANACFLSTQFATELAKKYNTQIHILHMTTAAELEFFSSDKVDNKHITVEACPHHLWFSNQDYDQKGSFIKCNPSIKSSEDRQSLRKALQDGLIDTIGTDHAPHLINEKENTYFNSPSGMPIVQSALPSLLEYLTPELVAQKTAHNPSIIYKCKDRGFIREGYFADLTIINNQEKHTVNKNNIHYKCGWSPFEGVTFSSTIHATFVNGILAYRDGIFNDDVRGMRLIFDR